MKKEKEQYFQNNININTVQELVDWLGTLESYDIPVETPTTHGISVSLKSNNVIIIEDASEV